jgi:hydrogenase expression/formation protein HypC
MCIGVPMRIESGDGIRALAVRERDGAPVERHALDMMIVGAQPPGTWVLAFHGAARRVLDPLEARQIGDALAALALAVGDGDGDAAGVDALFADLTGRTPQLPDHLQPK